MESWSTAEVCRFIEGKGFDKDVIEAFCTNKICGEVLPILTDADLKELGVAALGDRRLLLKSFQSTPTMPTTVKDLTSVKKHTEKGEDALIHDKPERTSERESGGDEISGGCGQLGSNDADTDIPALSGNGHVNDNEKIICVLPEVLTNESDTEKKIPVHFHVLIPVSVWNWNEFSQLKIYYQNNEQQSEHWKEVSPKWKQHHWSKINAYEMNALVHLSSSDLNESISYKYLVFTPSSNNAKWEYIHDLSTVGTFNRCLELKQSLANQNQLDVYDGFIFPNTTLWNKINNYFSVTGINTKLSHGYALQIFLKKVDLSIQGFELVQTLESVIGIYSQIKEKMYTDGKRYAQFCCNDQLDKGLQQWFSETVRYVNDYQNITTHMRIWSAKVFMAIATVIDLTGVQPLDESNTIIVMLSYLYLEKNVCKEVVEQMDISTRKKVSTSLAHICSTSMKIITSAGGPYYEWLFAIPLLHELQSHDEVSHDETDPSNMNWGIDHLEKQCILDFKKCVQEKKMMNKLFIELKDHINDDHSLLRLLVYLSCEDDIDVVLSNAPVHIVALHFADIWWNSTQKLKKVEKRLKVLNSIIEFINENSDQSVDDNIDQSIYRFKLTLIAATCMLNKMVKVCSNVQEHMKMLCSTLELFLCSLNAFVSKETDDDDATDKVVEYAVTGSEYLKKWLKKIDFGDSFGGKGGCKIKDELKLWNDVLTILSKYDLSPNINQHWGDKLKVIINSRIYSDQVEISTCINAALEICDSKENIHSILSDIIWKSVTELMDNENIVKETQYLMDKKNKKTNVGVLFSSLLTKYHSKKEVNLKTLFSFRLWPGFLRHFVTSSEVAQQFNTDCTKICTKAMQLLRETAINLKKGTIMIEQLDILTENSSETLNLYSSKIVQKISEDSSFNIKTLIHQRNNEVKKFQFYCSAVRTLLDHCESISTRDIVVHLQENLQKIDSPNEYAKIKVCELFEDNNGKEVYALLNINNEVVMKVLKPFEVMMKHKKTVTTLNIWNNQIHKLKSHLPLPLPEVITKIWHPVFNEIQQLIERFYDRSVTVWEIGWYLNNVSASQLKDELSNLVEGCNLCLSKKCSTTWISQLVVSINNCRDAIKAESTADLILKVKDTLMLTGSFKELELFKSKISNQRKLTLNEFEQVSGYEISSLKGIVESEVRMKFLKVLSNSKEFIVWLKEETNDITELQHLVGLSVSEDDKRTMDRIAKLHTVGTAIAPVVYGLEKSDGFLKFLEVCELIWSTVDHNPKLCDLFEFCCQNENLKILKQIKNLKTPIEVSTFDQVKVMLESGEYHISCKYDQVLCSTDEIIILEITDTSKSKKYTLSDLKDLESKIILIRDSKTSTVHDKSLDNQDVQQSLHNGDIYSQENSSKKMEYFLTVFHNVLHIADTLLHLQRAGHPLYVECSRSFAINEVSQNELKAQNDEMKNDFKLWKDKVLSLRKKFYGLNYFTCLQLLSISEEFFYLLNDPNYKISNKILLLLMSLSQDVTLKKIKKLMTTNEAQRMAKSYPLSFKQSDDQEANYDTMAEIGSITEKEQLNDAENKVYTACVKDYNLDPSMVLMAIGLYKSDEQKVLGWCSDRKNIEMYGRARPVVSETSVNLNILESEIDSNNAVVQELVGMQYEESLCIEAIMECGKDLQKCIGYCTKQTLARSKITSKDRHDKICDDTVIHAEDTKSKEKGLPDSKDLSVGRKESRKKPTFIYLKDTGRLLDALAKSLFQSQFHRQLNECFVRGTANFLSVHPYDIFKTVLSIYAQGEYKNVCLPTMEEVLVCNHHTTAEEISLLWLRAVRDPDHKRIFCLVNGEKLPYKVCVKAFEEMDKLLKDETDYQLVIVCSNEDKEEKSYIMEHLQLSRRDASAVMATDDIIQDFVKYHLSYDAKFEQRIFASEVDNNKCNVRVIRSRKTSMGKSLYVERITRKLEFKLKKPITYPVCVTIPIHGPNVDFDKVMNSLLHHANPVDPFPQIFHFDIASSVLEDVDALLFSILILKGLKDRSGNVWRCFPQQLYLVEATYSQDTKAGDDMKKSNTTELFKFMPTITCCSPKDVVSHVQDTTDTFHYDEEEMLSEQYQRPYQYLQQLSRSNTNPTDDMKSFLKVVLKYFKGCGVTDPSWMELRHFLWFLNAQLADCENSVFCTAQFISDTLPDFKEFVLRFMLKMSQDFAVPSLRIAAKNMGVEETELPSSQQLSITEKLEILPSKVWEHRCHPYIFFNKDHVSMTFIGFCVNHDGVLIDPTSKCAIGDQRLTHELLQGLKAQKVTFDDDGSTNQNVLLDKILTVMGVNTERLYRMPDSSYVLTADNTKKILAILMRFRCNIPVVLMGETGCGKTRLIKYMCDLLSLNSVNSDESLVIMKVHGGVTEEDIIREVNKAEKLAKENAAVGLETVMFFDEANTTEAIGLIKEIMCDRRIDGKPIKENIKFIAACNPYRMHSSEMINKLENAGLGYYITSAHTMEKLGNIPLRHLVYRVLDLPASMQSLVYDFGQLNNDSEEDYANKIVQQFVGRIPNLEGHKVNVITILMACQKYMRHKKDECSFVSLRDIERAMIVLEWFHSILDYIEKDPLYKDNKCDRHTRALVLTIAVCYYAKLQFRTQFEAYIAPMLMRNNDNPPARFKREIIRCQEVFLQNMKLPKNVARNNALRENVFMMVVCIELKIPLFLVGKPGSSKSLAKSIVADSMQGAASLSPLFQQFKQVQFFSYQCSQHSTSETILEVFNNATKFQEKKNDQKCISVVVLDEVGLAEDSPSLPLKTLHPLLEDGTTGSRDIADRIAFVGISNWALDPAKMNRGIMVTRDDPTIDELVLSARGICSRGKDEISKTLDCFFFPFAEAYHKICKQQAKHGKEFFGLRDFYSLIKMMYWISEKSGKKLTANQIKHCLMRNFGGKTDVDQTVQLFLEKLSNNLLQANSKDDSYDTTLLGMVQSSLQSKDKSWHGENRHLLFLTENYAALRILQQRNLIDKDSLILFGSSFPYDLNYTQVCRNINQIKFCMDTGRIVILLNLEHLYASLYDVLNQCYITLSDRRYVDLGLQSHRIKCRVHDNFKLVLIADGDKVYKTFPTPLINRLEKHYLVTSNMLSNNQMQLKNKLEIWIENFSSLLKNGDAFIGYQSDTAASIVFKVWEDLQLDKVKYDKRWEDKALLQSQELLFKMTTPDAIARSKRSKLSSEWEKMCETFFKIHSYFTMKIASDSTEFTYSHLGNFLHEQLKHNSDKDIMVQITTFSPLLRHKDLSTIQNSLGLRKNQIALDLLTLQQFDTELDFCERIRSVFQRKSEDESENHKNLLIVQCESGHQHIDLIACAQYCVRNEKAQLSESKNNSHIVFIISLSRRCGGTKFMGFEGGTWNCYHMDSIMLPTDSIVLPNYPLLTLKSTLNTPIKDILICCFKNNPEVLQKRLQNWISLSFLHYNNVRTEQAMLRRFVLLSQMIKQKSKIIPNTQTNQDYFFKNLLKHTINTLKCDDPPEYQQQWAIREALDTEALHNSGSYINTLLLKLDSVAAEFLNDILNAVDRYSNLYLLQSEVPAISSLWLKIFEDEEIISNLTNVSENTNFSPGNAVFASFKCCFPFFWLLIDKIENVRKNTNNPQSIDVYNTLQVKSIADKLKDVNSEEVFEYYTQDFIMYYNGSSEDNKDTKIIRQIVCNEYQRIAQDALDVDNILLYKIILLNEAYHKIEPQLHQLKQILTLDAFVSTRLQTYFSSETSMGIDLYAVQELLVILQPNFKLWKKEDCRQWLRAVHNCQNTVDATILGAIKNQDQSSVCKKLRIDWHFLRVLQIFVEHTIEHEPDVARVFALRIYKFLENDHDFTKLSAYNKLKTMIDSYAGDIQIDLSKIREKARNSCHMLFMEIVSEIIFAVSSSTLDEPPEDDLVSELIKTVIPTTGSTQQLSPLTDDEADEIPVVRSYLLQLLLDHDLDKIRPHLNSYFKRSWALMQSDDNFLVLYTRCFEV